MVLTHIFIITSIFLVSVESCILAENSGEDPLHGQEFDKPGDVYAFTKPNYDDPTLNANIQRSIEFWAPSVLLSDKTLMKLLNTHHAKSVANLGITVTIAELDQSKEENRFCLLVLEHWHLKFVGDLTNFDQANMEKAEYIKNAAERVKIPIWEARKGYVKQRLPYTKRHVALWMENKGYVINSVWSLTTADLTHDIVMLQHKAVNEKHSHYRFLSATAKQEFGHVNYVGGHMRTPLLAEISAANFLTLDVAYTKGTWNEDAKVTWNENRVSLEDLNLGKATRTVTSAIISEIPAEIRASPGLPLPVKIEFRIGLDSKSMPCKNVKELEEYLCQNIVDFFWLQAVVMDNNKGVHVVGLILRYRNKAFLQIDDKVYLGNYTLEDYYKAFDETDTAKATIYVGDPPEIVISAPPQEEEQDSSHKLQKASNLEKHSTTPSISPETVASAPHPQKLKHRSVSFRIKWNSSSKSSNANVAQSTPEVIVPSSEPLASEQKFKPIPKRRLLTKSVTVQDIRQFLSK